MNSEHRPWDSNLRSVTAERSENSTTRGIHASATSVSALSAVSTLSMCVSLTEMQIDGFIPKGSYDNPKQRQPITIGPELYTISKRAFFFRARRLRLLFVVAAHFTLCVGTCRSANYVWSKPRLVSRRSLVRTTRVSHFCCMTADNNTHT